MLAKFHDGELPYWRNVILAKFYVSEMCWQNFMMENCHVGEMSYWQNVMLAKCVGKIS
jgi:hypothetical protein